MEFFKNMCVIVQHSHCDVWSFLNYASPSVVHLVSLTNSRQQYSRGKWWQKKWNWSSIEQECFNITETAWNWAIALLQFTSSKNGCFGHCQAQIVIMGLTNLQKRSLQRKKTFFFTFRLSARYYFWPSLPQGAGGNLSEGWRGEWRQEFVLLDFGNRSLVLSKRFGWSRV